VCLASGGTADQQWLREAALGHLAGVEDHLVERGRDQAREADDVGTPCFSFFKNVSQRPSRQGL
jgi:hypothetical protein